MNTEQTENPDGSLLEAGLTGTITGAAFKILNTLGSGISGKSI